MFWDIFGAILLGILVAVICISSWKEMHRAAQYHRKRMMMLDEMHEYFARCNEKER